MNLNKVLLIGRMAADPESRTTPSGQTVVTLRIATNRVWNNRNTGERQEQTEFHTVIAWSGLADIASKYLRKGQLAFFEGRLQTRSWQGQDGVKRYRTEIIAENLQLGPKAAGSTSYAPTQNQNYRQPNQPQHSNQSTVKDADIPVINEDAPTTSLSGQDEPIRQAQDEPIISDNEIEEKEIDLKDIPF